MELACSAISLTEEMGNVISTCEGAALCGFAGLTKETLAVATGVDFITPRALEVGDVLRPGFVIILLCFLNPFFVYFEPRLWLRLCSAGNKRKGLPIRQAVVHLVNLAPLAVHNVRHKPSRTR